MTPTPTPTATASALATYTYDANGNMNSNGTNCFHYNEANKMDKVTDCATSATIAEYVYDYKGDRMVKKNYVNGVLDNTVISWGDGFETKTIASTSAVENTSYYFANGQQIAKKDKDGNITYVHNDHLGSASVITDATGAVVEETKYDPWGKINAGGTKSKFLYTGQEHDGETGLHYYGARYYDADLKRFIQPDPVIQNIYDPQSLNRYSYVRNNPLRYTDPTGYNWFSDAWNKVTSFFGGNTKKQEPAPISTQQLQKSCGCSNISLNQSGSNAIISAASSGGSGGSSSSENVSSGNIATSTGVAAVGGAIIGSTNYSVYVGENSQEAIQYVGITKQAPITRFTQHLTSGDPIRSSLNYRTLYSNLSRLAARGSEQTYIETYNLIENGANKINSISINNPIYQQAKDDAYAVGAVPGAVTGLSGVMEVIGKFVKQPFVIPDYSGAANSLIEYQSL